MQKEGLSRHVQPVAATLTKKIFVRELATFGPKKSSLAFVAQLKSQNVID